MRLKIEESKKLKRRNKRRPQSLGGLVSETRLDSTNVDGVASDSRVAAGALAALTVTWGGNPPMAADPERGPFATGLQRFRRNDPRTAERV